MRSFYVIIDSDDGEARLTFDGTDLFVDKDGGGDVKVIDADSIGDEVQEYSSNLDMFSSVTPSVNGLSLVSAANYEAMQVLLDVATNIQAESLDNEDTLTPVVGYENLTILVTGSTSPTNIIFSESGSESTNDTVTIINVGTNDIIFSDQSTVIELPGTVKLSTGGFITAKYITDRYYGFPSGSLYDYVSQINLSPNGIVSGAHNVIVISSDYDLTTLEVNTHILVTDTAKISIPQSAVISASQSGVWLDVKKITGNAVSIRSLDASVQPVLFNGTPLTAGNELDLAAATGSRAKIVFAEENKMIVWDEDGTVVDGGSSSGETYTLYDQYDTAPNSSLIVSHNLSNNAFVGLRLTPDSTISVKKVAFYVSSITGDISDRDYFVRIYTLSGNDITPASPVSNGTSDELDGGDVSVGRIEFTFSTAPTLTGAVEYVVAIYSVADGDGASGALAADSSNYFWLGFTNGTSVNDMDNGLIATNGKRRWNSSGTYVDGDATDDVYIEIFT